MRSLIFLTLIFFLYLSFGSEQVGSARSTPEQERVAREQIKIEEERERILHFARQHAASEMQHKRKKGHVYVTKVIDGDTFWVADGVDKIKVRFIGIDAPETRNSGRKKKGHFGEEAKAYVTKAALHKWVRLELDVKEKDQYQRLLAYIYLEDGTFLNAHLIANGYAVLDTYPPNVKYVDLFTDLQQKARDHKRGLWAD